MSANNQILWRILWDKTPWEYHFIRIRDIFPAMSSQKYQVQVFPQVIFTCKTLD